MTVIATCHCGGTTIELPEAPTHALECSCTFCTKSGGLWAYYPVTAPLIVSDQHKGEYSASDGINRHFFCSNCGCATYGISPDWTLESTTIPEKQKFAINVRLIDDYALIKSLAVETIDGRNLW